MADLAPSAQDDLELLRSAAIHAGIIALGYFRRDLKSWTKNQTSPVSEADIAVDRFLYDALTAMRPDYGWLSEESEDTEDRLACRRAFIVDPIDGTRGFLKGDDSWTVTMAVVEDGVPVAGLVYAPVRDEMYAASRGNGATLNGAPLYYPGPGEELPVIPAPMAVHARLEAAGLDYVRGPAYPSLAYRLVQVAAGELDAAVARRGAQDWDIAGADLVLSEAGVGLLDVCRGAPRYNAKETRHAALAATADPSLRSLLGAALREVYGCPEPARAESDSNRDHP